MRVARRLAGSRRVTAIVGQGPHVVQPIKRLRRKFVVFSEGNLVSNERAATGQPAATQDGLIAMLDMQATGSSVKGAARPLRADPGLSRRLHRAPVEARRRERRAARFLPTHRLGGGQDEADQAGPRLTSQPRNSGSGR